MVPGENEFDTPGVGGNKFRVDEYCFYHMPRKIKILKKNAFGLLIC